MRSKRELVGIGGVVEGGDETVTVTVVRHFVGIAANAPTCW